MTWSKPHVEEIKMNATIGSRQVSLRAFPICYLALSVLVAACSSEAPNSAPAIEGASAGETAQAGSRTPSASAVAHRALPAETEQREVWRKSMARNPLPNPGCFRASYPGTWEEVACEPQRAAFTSTEGEAMERAPVTPELSGSLHQQVDPSVGRSERNIFEAEATTVEAPSNDLKGFSANSVGAGNGDWNAFISSGNEISWAEGWFPFVYFAEPNSQPGAFEFQLNTNPFSTPACNGISGCQGWQQFIYQNNDVFIQYWLLGYGTPCPANWNLPNGGTYTNGRANCGINGNMTAAIAGLSQLSSIVFTGVQYHVGGCSGCITQQTVLFDGTTMYGAGDGNYDQDSLYLNNGSSGEEWTHAEFNIFGNGNGANLQIAGNAAIVVQLLTSDYPNADATGPVTAPAECVNTSYTLETNSLDAGLGNASNCCSFGGPTPGIQFLETNYSGPAMYACPSATGLAASQQFGISNQTDVFAIDANGSLRVTAVQNAGVWASYQETPPAGDGFALFTPGVPVVASQQFGISNQTDAFAVNNNGALEVVAVQGAGGWASYQESPENLFPIGAPVAASQQFGIANQTDVFAVDVNGNLDVMSVQGGGSWALQTVASGFVPGSHLAASQQFGISNQTDVFAIDNNGALEVLAVQGAGEWARYVESTRVFPPGAPVAASQQFGIANQTDVFAVDVNGNLDVVSVQGGGSWTLKTIASGFAVGSFLAASQQFGISNQTDVFVINNSGALQVLAVQSAGEWASYVESPAGKFNPGEPVAASQQFGIANQTDVFAVGVDGNLDVMSVQSAGAWAFQSAIASGFPQGPYVLPSHQPYGL